jgi:hypothetical protein
MHNNDDDDDDDDGLPKYVREASEIEWAFLLKMKTKQIFHEQLYYLPKFHKNRKFLKPTNYGCRKF